MTVEHRTGDLFAQTDLPAIGQGVNTQGKMGSGIAPVFKRYWPDMYEEYRQRCLNGELTVGGLHTWQAPSGVWIYNLASQQQTGRDARLDAIESSLALAIAHAHAHEVTAIGVPRIGAGIGGLRWDDVLGVIHSLADNDPVRIVCVSLPNA